MLSLDQKFTMMFIFVLILSFLLNQVCESDRKQVNKMYISFNAPRLFSVIYPFGFPNIMYWIKQCVILYSKMNKITFAMSAKKIQLIITQQKETFYL